MQIVKCRMSHERVVRDEVTGLPVPCRFPAGQYQRVGLCTPDQRARRLGCSHSTARIKLGDAIKALGAAYDQNDSAGMQFSSELTRLDNAIHLLDHQKGEAEKCLAARLGKGIEGGEPGVREAERAIGEMEALHDRLVEQVERLRDRVVSAIHRRLEEIA